ncbi:MAG: hypothetical protein ABMA00_19775 [Gemmatimonas sp.]
MKESRATRVIAAFFTSSLMLVSGCGGTSTVEPATHVSIQNATTDSVAVFLFEREDSYLVDPIPETSSAAMRDRLIPPGGQRLFELTQVLRYQSGKDLRVFIYRVRQGRAVFAAIRDASSASLRSNGYAVEIPATAFQSP